MDLSRKKNYFGGKKMSFFTCFFWDNDTFSPSTDMDKLTLRFLTAFALNSY